MQIQSCACSLIWCDDHAAACSEEDINLVTGLLSWWELTDHVSAYTQADQGPANLPLNIDGPFYLHDTDRGGEPGALDFSPNHPNAFASVDDASGIYISTENPITIGLWVKLATKTVGSILTYHNTGGTTVRYQLFYSAFADRFVFTVVGTSGSVIINAHELGSPTVGEWYWIELSYDPATLLAGIRVADTRTADLVALDAEADTGAVPGGLAEAPGSLHLGNFNSGNSFDGCLAAVGFWTKTLNDCERGRLNMPTDYPFTAAVAAGFESEGEDSFVAEDGSTTFDPE